MQWLTEGIEKAMSVDGITIKQDLGLTGHGLIFGSPCHLLLHQSRESSPESYYYKVSGKAGKMPQFRIEKFKRPQPLFFGCQIGRRIDLVSFNDEGNISYTLVCAMGLA
jgi:hypothetical protein